MNEHLDSIMDFLRNHGANEVSKKITGGGHTRINYWWKGQPKNYVTSSTPSDSRATKNSIAQLRRILGDPIMQEPKVKRTLEGMMASLPLPKEEVLPMPMTLSNTANAVFNSVGTNNHSVGYIALYDDKSGRKKRFRISFPKTLHDEIGATHLG